MKKFILFSLLAFLLSGFIMVFAEDASDDSIEDNLRLHVYDDVDLISTIKYQYAKPKITIKLVYPQLESDSNNQYVNQFNQLVLDKIQEKIRLFKEEAKTIAMTSPITASNELNIDFDAASINAGNNQIISIRLTMQAYIAGMAHPSHQYTVLNYNLDSGEELELSHLFKEDADYLTLLSDYTREVLFKRLESKELILSGTTPTEDHFKNWNIKPKGIMITFNEGEVAPYVSGAQMVFIPYSVLKNIVSTKSPIKKCISKKSCSNNPLLTGGFIDNWGM